MNPRTSSSYRRLQSTCTVAAACMLAVAVQLPGAGPASPSGITAEDIAEHARYLASEELGGRRAGQRGAELAASYITWQLKDDGFEPLGATWELPFAVRGGATDGFGTFGLGNTHLSAPNLVQAPSYSPAGVVRAPVTINADSDLTNKIVAVNTEAGANERQRAADLIARGAVGVIFLRDASSLDPAPPAHQITFSSDQTLEELWPELDEETRQLALQSMRLDAPVIAISSNLRKWVLQSAAESGEVTIEVRRLGRDQSTNVAGVLQGADPTLRHEYVIVCAHYDHIGVMNGETHYGADDNASGTSAVLEIAEALATMLHRPRRSIVVIAWGAEEMNMIGSKEFCRNPPIDLDKVAAVINLDMVGRNDPEMVQVLAASDDLRRIAVDAATRNGFTKTDGNPVFLEATDTAPFVRRNVPSVFFNTDLHPDYNTPRDTVDRLDIDKVARVARAAFEVAVEVANADQPPKFTPYARELPEE